MVTVETLPGKRSAQIGALSPKSLARILLRELATEGLEPLCDFVHQRIVICLPIRPKCDCGHRFSFSSSLILIATSDLGQEEDMTRKPDGLTKLGLATTIAALWLTVVPITGAVANEQISAARAAALQGCNRLAQRYPLHEWGNTQIHLYRTCMARHGQQE